MNTPRFDYFIALARERSFTKAAKQLHITQQTLSNYVAQLEKEIGSTLFVRNIPLKLTYAGEIYLRYALAIQNQMENMQHELDDVSQKERGFLKIGIAFSRGRILMPKVIAAFQKEHPFVQVKLVETSNEEQRIKLLNHEIDLVITNFTEDIPGVTMQDFYDEENVLLSLYAKETTNAKVITKVDHNSFNKLISKLDLDTVIYPCDITIEYILQYVRANQNAMGNNVESLYKLVEDKVEALEFKVGDTAPIIGIPLQKMDLKDELIICGIIHKGKFILPNGDSTVEAGDRIIVVTSHKKLDDVGDILR